MDMILENRFERAQEAIESNNIDAWVFCGRETNILSEPSMLFLMPTQVAGRTTVVITKDERIIICGAMQMEEMERSGLFTKHILFRTLSEYEEKIAEILKQLPQCKKIALNMSESDSSSDGLTVTAYNMLQRCFKTAGIEPEIVSSSPVMKMVRGKKSDTELAGIQRAVNVAMEVYDEARPQMKRGMSGKDIQNLFKSIIRVKGAGYSWHEPENPYVSVGTRSSYLCKMPPDDVFIEPGDVINVDLGLKIDGFASDDQRTFYALCAGETEPPEEVQRAFSTLQQINSAVVKQMKVGADSGDLTAIGNEIMLANGYENGYKGAYGHELGIFAHAGGISSGLNTGQPDLDKTLEYNMTFTLEPSIITSRGRVCQEEVVVCKPDGGYFLSKPQTEIWLIP